MPKAIISTERPAEGRQDRIVLVVTRPQRDKPEDYTRKQYFSYDEAVDVYVAIGKALLGVGRKLPPVVPVPDRPVPRPPQARP